MLSGWEKQEMMHVSSERQTRLHLDGIDETSLVGQLVKNPPANAGGSRDVGLIPGLGGSLGEANGNPLQSSCLENSMDRRAWQVTVHGMAKSQTQMSTYACSTFLCLSFMGLMIVLP